jgi:DNA-binding CsgD family transcriptional regulator
LVLTNGVASPLRGGPITEAHQERESTADRLANATRQPLLGRREECDALGRMLDAVRRGESRALLIRGEPGVGKSSLLDYAAAAADEFRIVRAAGVESEIELPYAGLQQLCAPILDGLESLPVPQREALGIAFGLLSGEAPDRFIVSLALLTLLSNAAEEQPLLCLVDDAQWLDPASARALGFVARRLEADSVCMVLAARASGDEWEGLPELLVSGLNDSDARKLLDTVLLGRFDDTVRERLLAETRGNPLALLELPWTLTSAEAASGLALHSGVPLSGRIERSFRLRLAPLPDDTRRLMLIAAADPLGDPMLLRRATETLDIGSEAAYPAEEAGLLEMRDGLTFRHPLVRSAVYRSASAHERRRVHEALAEATDPDLDPDRRAWHRAQATPAPEEDVAAELERTAERARSRGGLAAAAAFLERATLLTPDPVRRAERALSAAALKHEAGAFDEAERLLGVAEHGPLSELQSAWAEQLHGRIGVARAFDKDALLLLVRVAGRLAPLDPGLAQEAALEALVTATEVGDADALAAVAGALEEAPVSDSPRAAELLLRGWSRLLNDGFPAGTDLLREAMVAFRDEPMASEADIRALHIAVGIASSLWDIESWFLVAGHCVRLARDSGALAALPAALDLLADVQATVGEFDRSAAALEEADMISEATGSVRSGDQWPRFHAWRDEEARALEQIERCERAVGRRGGAMIYIELARALLYNGVGRYEAALLAAQRSCQYHPLKAFGRGLSELVEAAVRCGERARALAAFDQLAERTQLGGTDWGLGTEARARALLHEGAEAERSYLEAVERLGRTPARPDLARAHLVYGEWLRRENRRIDAREQLRVANEMFDAMGAVSFAERARRELRATGETARKRSDDTRSELTAQEAQIARLAASGRTNPEIGAELFLSPRTVEWHLRKIYPKLGIASRKELAGALPSAEAARV